MITLDRDFRKPFTIFCEGKVVSGAGGEHFHIPVHGVCLLVYILLIIATGFGAVR